ncbi:MAG: spore protease YyaC [Firmicutes bacterium]|nr:spore protease YyaC [Bacillota bacterium]
MGQGQQGARVPGAARGEVRVHMDDPAGPAVIGAALVQVGREQLPSWDEIVVVCIGTDRSIGDALGPLVGSLLLEQGPAPFRVLGTLEEPVHAGNLGEVVARLEGEYRRPLVVGVDACLGRSESVGYVTVGRGPVRPGAGVNKSLPPVGQVAVTGVVNVGGFMEYFVLQNTRLNLVMRMARVVAAGLRQGLTELARLPREAGL